ncbi:bifunctional 4-hydroxy-2-oxoglutarate aldolase/2-dehydro-3-deoxy-phosphogluconate aldolase [Atribacter laminatus]|uniref:KHG/KDPG aldolase n=1 Tax=Atribacter laminatus TaxID=2847778 RepID=A0A7T1AJK2_ATRLM|nr:bifunctional 4-hydroxy-2-oxoglutarate aldolase/2-dehydro-3-deoxy-phosphogluconate aldolase [Atribacter laminatus]QPM67114.1 KHG/KDPG aldolase [Atribacter laminatus]
MYFKDRFETIHFIERKKIVAIIRAKESGSFLDAVKALKKGGIECIEVTMTTPGALKTLEEVRSKIDDVLFGAGTVLDPETARQAILSGAQFIVTPSLNLEAIRLSHRYDIPIIPGAFTPTEILSAWENGAECVKVFPASNVGPDYIKAIKGPFPQIKICPTGGIGLDNMKAFLKAGASCLGVGGKLVDASLIKNQKWDDLTSIAKEYVAQLND